MNPNNPIKESHKDELMENWELAQKKQELFEIEPLNCIADIGVFVTQFEFF